MSAYPLTILTPEKKLYHGKVVSITVPGENGQITVLAQHAPMLAVLANGLIIIHTETETVKGKTGQGILKVGRNEAIVLVHSFQWVDDEKKNGDAFEKVETENLIP